MISSQSHQVDKSFHPLILKSYWPTPQHHHTFAVQRLYSSLYRECFSCLWLREGITIASRQRLFILSVPLFYTFIFSFPPYICYFLLLLLIFIFSFNFLHNYFLVIFCLNLQVDCLYYYKYAVENCHLFPL